MSRSPDSLVVQFLDVGQGDAAVVFLPKPMFSRALVMDAYDYDSVINALRAENIDEIVVFLSHSDEDHVDGAPDLLDNFGGRLVGVFFNADRTNTAPRPDYELYLRNLNDAIRKHDAANPNARVFEASFDTSLNRMPDFTALVPNSVVIKVLHPDHSNFAGLAGTDRSWNDLSGVLRISYKPKRQQPAQIVLFTGDAQLTALRLMYERYRNDLAQLGADVLKFPHHGSWPASARGSRAFSGLPAWSMDQFLAAVDPQLVVISTGFDNTDRHVQPDVFTALQTLAVSGRLRRITCTQFTPTCTRHRPNPAPPHCAGDVTVTFHPTPPMTVDPAAVAHATRIRLHTLPAERGCEHMLPPVPPPAPPPTSPSPSRSKSTGTRAKTKPK